MKYDFYTSSRHQAEYASQALAQAVFSSARYKAGKPITMGMEGNVGSGKSTLTESFLTLPPAPSEKLAVYYNEQFIYESRLGEQIRRLDMLGDRIKADRRNIVYAQQTPGSAIDIIEHADHAPKLPYNIRIEISKHCPDIPSVTVPEYRHVRMEFDEDALNLEALRGAIERLDMPDYVA